MGLKKTINPDNPLAPKTALGALGTLGSGNVSAGVMTNTVAPAKPVYNYRGGLVK
jgi:hypothetical protein